jgi:hypothetical protein
METDAEVGAEMVEAAEAGLKLKTAAETPAGLDAAFHTC